VVCAEEWYSCCPVESARAEGERKDELNEERNITGRSQTLLSVHSRSPLARKSGILLSSRKFFRRGGFSLQSNLMSEINLDYSWHILFENTLKL
jgi:hypothetical protein